MGDGPRWIQPGENPFRERNPINAKKRKELLNPQSKRNEEIARLMNERAKRIEIPPNRYGEQ